MAFLWRVLNLVINLRNMKHLNCTVILVSLCLPFKLWSAISSIPIKRNGCNKEKKIVTPAWIEVKKIWNIFCFSKCQQIKIAYNRHLTVVPPYYTLSRLGNTYSRPKIRHMEM
jgi:hypothetical protein